MPAQPESAPHRAACAALPFLLLVLLQPAAVRPAAAQFVGVVTVGADLPAERHFMLTSMRWDSLLARVADLQRQGEVLIRQGNEAAEVMGDPRRASSRISGGTSVLESLRKAASLPPAEDTLAAARPADGVRRPLLGYYEGKRTIGEAFRVPGGDVRRDTWLYADLAKEDALRERHARALRNLDEVEAEEARVYRELHERLRGSPTLAEVQLIQTALQGVQLRSDYARSQATRAFAELEAVRGVRVADEERVRRAREEEQFQTLRVLAEKSTTLEKGREHR